MKPFFKLPASLQLSEASVYGTGKGWYVLDFLVSNLYTTLISLINEEVGVNMEGVQKWPNH